MINMSVIARLLNRCSRCVMPTCRDTVEGEIRAGAGQGKRAGTSRPSFSIRAMHTVYSGLPDVLIDRSKMSKSQSSICDTSRDWSESTVPDQPHSVDRHGEKEQEWR